MKNKFSILNSQFSIRGGFTLIELLVVIVIIGILSAFLMVNFIGIRQRGRDAQRKSDMRQIQVALELYRSDNDGYPATLPGCGDVFAPGGITYMQKMPCNPSGGSGSMAGTTYIYVPNVTTTPPTQYSLAVCIENKNDQDPNVTDVPSFACDSMKSYVLSNP